MKDISKLKTELKKSHAEVEVRVQCEIIYVFIYICIGRRD